eukprot:m.162919 g.162919  ORF g.162919 m.162919 type:complete len:646 (-) comp18088_c0_seq1:138-2075(-)
MRELTARDAPRPPPGIENIIIIDNVPMIPESKVPKLTNVISKILSASGEVVSIELPLDESTKKTKGFAFVEFRTKEQALEAEHQCNGYPLDKKHVFSINNMSEFGKIMATPETWEAPSEKDFDDKESLQWWLMYNHCNDQYVIRHDNMTEVMWCRKTDSMTCESRANWSDRYVAWSPKGTYLATFHRQGIILHGGKRWQRIGRFAHPNVTVIDFSPSENYLITWSSDAPADAQNAQAVVVWDIKSGARLRDFDVGKEPEWPVLKWSHDDKYAAKMKDNHQMITVYEAPSMSILDKRSLKIKDVKDYQWSPTDNIISYWVPEEGNLPAKVVLLKLPERVEISSKNMYSVKECKLLWQKSGDHLCVSVERWTKSKKQTYTQFMIFSMREKLVPCEIIEIKEKILNFAWEPVGSKFAVLHGESPRIALNVYGSTDGKVELLKSIERVTANGIFWSPRGRHLVVAGLGVMQGVLEFIDTKDFSTMGTGEHFMATDVEWDPTGRFVISSVSFWRHQTDTGYYVWSFQGKLLQRELRDKFYQLLWRPRPPTLLSADQISDVQKNLKKYHSQFEAEDKMQQTKESDEVLQRRKHHLDEWEELQNQARYRFEKRKDALAALRPAVDDAHDETITQVEDVFINETVEVFDVKIK